MFEKYLAQLNDLAQNHTHENFVQIQKVRVDILTTYAEGGLNDFEKRHLFGISSIIMNEMRETLGLKKGTSNGTEKNPDGSD